MKTLAIRLEDELHAQLSVLAQLEGITITEEIRQAIEAHLLAKRLQPDIASKAQAVLEDIERDAEARRDAIATMFGGEPAADTAPPAKAASRKTARTSSDEGSSSA
jgi:predicted DNA-binding protein